MLFITSEEATTPAVSDLRILLPRVTGTEFIMLPKSFISFGEKSPSGPMITQTGLSVNFELSIFLFFEFIKKNNTQFCNHF